MYTLDFETHPIVPGSPVTPKPIGFALRHQGASRYYTWEHEARGTDYFVPFPTATQILEEVWHSKEPVLCHNAAFDLTVAADWFDLPRLDPERIHDTEWLAFLVDPSAPSLSLKDLCRKQGWETGEESVLHEWIERNVMRDSRGKRVKDLPHGNKPGAYIYLAPPALVGQYACADVTMTADLFAALYPKVCNAKMLPAYERYQQAFYLLREMEAEGVWIDTARAKRQLKQLNRDIAHAEEYVSRTLGIPPRPTKAQLTTALQKKKAMDERKWDRYRTPKKQELQVSNEVIQKCLRPRYADLGRVLAWLSRAHFARTTFLEKFAACSGRIHPQWRATRHHNEQRDLGARTGRLSSVPNVQNVTKAKEVLEVQGTTYTLPCIRECVVAPPEHVLVDADYSQQEIRILAEYEDADLAEAYHQNPDLDVHEHAGTKIKDTTSLILPRGHIKNVAFGIIYGSGNARRAEQLGLDPESSSDVAAVAAMKAHYLDAMPGVKRLLNRLRRDNFLHITPADLGAQPDSRWTTSTRTFDPIYTIGSRVCFIEPAQIDESGDIVRTFAYKLLNTMVQGSAGDQLLESMVQVRKEFGKRVRFMLTAHDELVLIVPMALVTGKKRDNTLKRLGRAMGVRTSNRLIRPHGSSTRTFAIPTRVDVRIVRRWSE